MRHIMFAIRQKATAGQRMLLELLLVYTACVCIIG